MIKHITQKSKRGRIMIIVKCPDCGTWGHLTKIGRKLVVRHKTKIGGVTGHRITGELFEEIREIYNLYRIPAI